MGKLVVNEHLSLDGVMQAPGDADEDRSGSVPEAVAALKREPGKNIAVLGSGRLVRTLIEHDLVDEYALMIAPLLLGGGKRLFGHDGSRCDLRLVESTTTGTGVLFATYRPAGR